MAMFKKLFILILLSAALGTMAEAPLPSLKKLKWEHGRNVTIQNGILTSRAQSPGWNAAVASLDLSEQEGRQLIFTIRAKAENVTKPSTHFRGVKFMLSFKDAKGKRYAPQPFYVAGTFERELELKADIPAGVCDGKLILGLQDVTGKVSFDLSTLQVRENRNARKPLPRALRWQSSVSHRELNLTFAPGTPERAIADEIPFAAVSDGILSIFISAGKGKNRQSVIRIPIPPAKFPLAGKRIRLSGEIRLTDVTVPRDPWNGVKVMLYYRINGKGNYPTLYTNQYPNYGSAPWRTFRGHTNIPENATDLLLYLGLQDSDGIVDFRNLVLTIL